MGRKESNPPNKQNCLHGVIPMPEKPRMSIALLPRYRRSNQNTNCTRSSKHEHRNEPQRRSLLGMPEKIKWVRQCHVRIQMGDRGIGPPPPPPEKSQKYLSNIGPDPL